MWRNFAKRLRALLLQWHGETFISAGLENISAGEKENSFVSTMLHEKGEVSRAASALYSSNNR